MYLNCLLACLLVLLLLSFHPHAVRHAFPILLVEVARLSVVYKLYSIRNHSNNTSKANRCEVATDGWQFGSLLAVDYCHCCCLSTVACYLLIVASVSCLCILLGFRFKGYFFTLFLNWQLTEIIRVCCAVNKYFKIILLFISFLFCFIFSAFIYNKFYSNCKNSIRFISKQNKTNSRKINNNFNRK